MTKCKSFAKLREWKPCEVVISVLFHVDITNSVNSTSDLSETSTYFMVLGSTFSFTLSLLMYCIVLVSSCVCAPRSIPTMATGAHDNNGRNNPCKHLFITYKHLLHEYLIEIQSFKMNELLFSMTWRDKNWKLLYIGSWTYFWIEMSIPSK